MQKMLLVGATTLLLFAATFAVSPAVAQEDDREEREKARPHKKAPHERGPFVMGMGGAVELGEDELYRSKVRLKIEQVPSSTDSDADYAVKKGLIIINDEGSPVRYPAIADTWTIRVGEDGQVFSALGQVEDSEGNTYDVSLAGALLHVTNHGKLFVVEGKFSGNGEEYALYYIALVKDAPARPAVEAVVEDTINA